MVSAELKGYSDWPGLEQVFRLDRQRIDLKTGEIEEEVVYGLTSLSPLEASPARLLALTRAYWGAENGLHYRRDVTFREDATRLTKECATYFHMATHRPATAGADSSRATPLRRSTVARACGYRISLSGSRSS
jgi:hypothetical protein